MSLSIEANKETKYNPENNSPMFSLLYFFYVCIYLFAYIDAELLLVILAVH